MKQDLRSYLSILAAAATICLAPAAAQAQEIKVEQTAGVNQGSAQATLSLRTNDGSQVSVRRVTDQMTAAVTSNFGYSATAYGDVSQQLCVTPCKLSLPTGFYKLRFGDFNPMNHNDPVDFNLGPGDHRYSIKPYSTGKFISGFLLTLVGASAAIVGTTMALVQDDNKAPFAIMGGVGAGVTIGGIVLLVGAKAKAHPE